LIVWERIADSIWASGHDAASQAEHMIAIYPPVRILFEALEPKGPFSNRVIPVNSLLLLLAWKLSGWGPRQHGEQFGSSLIASHFARWAGSGPINLSSLLDS
jgi:hypothetical protein